MTKAELDYILGTMLDSHDNVSDLNITADKTLQVESSGELLPSFLILHRKAHSVPDRNNRPADHRSKSQVDR
jgi:hypothetical protein